MTRFAFAALLVAACGDDAAPDDSSATTPTSSSTGAETVRYGNAPETCVDELQLGPSATEEGSVLAARLLTPSWPFEVTGFTLVVSNEEIGGTTCDGGAEHTVVAYVSADGRPPADGAEVGRFTFEAAEVDGTSRPLNGTFDPPIRLEDGQDLYLGLVTSGAAPVVTCVRVCLDDPIVSGVDWWSQTTATPYDWVELGSLGFDAHLQAWAEGRAAE